MRCRAVIDVQAQRRATKFAFLLHGYVFKQGLRNHEETSQPRVHDVKGHGFKVVQEHPPKTPTYFHPTRMCFGLMQAEILADDDCRKLRKAYRPQIKWEHLWTGRVVYLWVWGAVIEGLTWGAVIEGLALFLKMCGTLFTRVGRYNESERGHFKSSPGYTSLCRQLAYNPLCIWMLPNKVHEGHRQADLATSCGAFPKFWLPFWGSP